MPIFKPRLLLWGVMMGLCLGLALPAGWAETLPFPAFSSRSLAGKAWNVPQDWKGQAHFLIVAFSDKKQPEINGWLRGFESASGASFGFYELPVLPQKYQSARPLIENYMRGLLPKKDYRARVIPVFTDLSLFCQKLKIASQDTIHILLVNPQGQVVARETGAFTPAKLNDLKARL